LVYGIYTKMSEQIDVWSLYSFVLNFPEDGTNGVETCSGLIRVMSCIVGSEFLWLICYLPWFHFQCSNSENDDFSKTVLARQKLVSRKQKV